MGAPLRSAALVAAGRSYVPAGRLRPGREGGTALRRGSGPDTPSSTSQYRESQHRHGRKMVDPAGGGPRREGPPSPPLPCEAERPGGRVSSRVRHPVPRGTRRAENCLFIQVDKPSERPFTGLGRKNRVWHAYCISPVVSPDDKQSVGDRHSIFRMPVWNRAGGVCVRCPPSLPSLPLCGAPRPGDGFLGLCPPCSGRGGRHFPP